MLSSDHSGYKNQNEAQPLYREFDSFLTLCLRGWVAHQQVYWSFGAGFDFYGQIA